jgi:energy-coupling factor transporter ATP-binding protein EcfA2
MVDASSPGVGFRDLTLRDWRQFDRVSLSFHPRLTVMTGANAAGKTTLLTLLASHFGWQTAFVGTPAKKRRGGVLSFLTGFWRSRRHDVESVAAEVGSITCTNGAGCQLQAPTELEGAAFNVKYSAQQPVSGLLFRPIDRRSSTSRSRRSPRNDRVVSETPPETRSRVFLLDFGIGLCGPKGILPRAR